jgi:hypothetical protein
MSAKVWVYARIQPLSIAYWLPILQDLCTSLKAKKIRKSLSETS